MLLSVRVKNGYIPCMTTLHEHINFVVMIKTFLTTERDYVTVVDPHSFLPPKYYMGDNY